MPLVFVHGVATRQTPEYQARVHQRDELFKALVLPKGAQIFDPDWGSNGVKFTQSMPWLPKPGVAQAWAIGGSVAPAGETRVGELAAQRPALAIDLAFEAGLEARVKAATLSGKPAEAMTANEFASFEAAVRYLEHGPDKSAYAAGSDAMFLEALSAEIKPPSGSAAQAMGWGSDALNWIGDGLKSLVSPVANVASDAVLRLVRAPLSESIALFLGDVFVYLRLRDTAGAAGSANRIFGPIAADLAKANALRKVGDPLIVVGHSLGAVILYDLLSDASMAAKIRTDSGAPLTVDALVTVGAQPGVFADMGLYGTSPAVGGLRPRPEPVQNWLNVYDWTDVLSFGCDKIFQDVTDFEFDNVSGLFAAHSAYFQRPSFYQRLRAHLHALHLLP
jgi:hypothetical protein